MTSELTCAICSQDQYRCPVKLCSNGHLFDAGCILNFKVCWNKSHAESPLRTRVRPVSEVPFSCPSCREKVTGVADALYDVRSLVSIKLISRSKDAFLVAKVAPHTTVAELASVFFHGAREGETTLAAHLNRKLFGEGAATVFERKTLVVQSESGENVNVEMSVGEVGAFSEVGGEIKLYVLEDLSDNQGVEFDGIDPVPSVAAPAEVAPAVPVVKFKITLPMRDYNTTSPRKLVIRSSADWDVNIPMVFNDAVGEWITKEKILAEGTQYKFCWFNNKTGELIWEEGPNRVAGAAEARDPIWSLPS